MVDPVESPLKLCIKELTELLLTDSSPLLFILRLWHRDSGPSGPFWSLWSFRGMQMVLGLLGKLILKDIEYTTFPALTWHPVAMELAHGPGTRQVLDSVTALHRIPTCCVDGYFGGKVLDKTLSPRQWIEAPQFRSMSCSKREVPMQNLDVERDIGIARRMCLGDNAIAASSLGNRMFCSKLSREHRRRGGTVISGHARSKDFKAAGIKGIHKQRQQKQGSSAKAKAKRTGPIAFYHGSILKDWGAARRGTTILRIGKRSRTEVKGRYAEAKPGVRRFVKGAGDWTAFADFKSAEFKRYRRSADLQAEWEAKAKRHNEEQDALESGQSSHARSGSAPVAEQESQASQDKNFTAESTWCGIGDATTPIRDSVLEVRAAELLAIANLPETHPMAGQTPSCLHAGRRVRQMAQDRFMIADNSDGLKEILPKLNLSKTCRQLHPGLCQHDHASIYWPVRQLSENLLTVASWADTSESFAGRIWRFEWTLKPGQCTFITGRSFTVDLLCLDRSMPLSTQVFGCLKLAKPDVDNRWFLATRMLQRHGREDWCMPQSYVTCDFFASTILKYVDATVPAWENENDEACPLESIYLSELFAHPSVDAADLHILTGVDAPSVVALRRLFSGKVQVYPGVLHKGLRGSASPGIGASADNIFDKAFDEQTKDADKYRDMLRKALQKLDIDKAKGLEQLMRMKVSDVGVKPGTEARDKDGKGKGMGRGRPKGKAKIKVKSKGKVASKTGPSTTGDPDEESSLSLPESDRSEASDPEPKQKGRTPRPDFWAWAEGRGIIHSPEELSATSRAKVALGPRGPSHGTSASTSGGGHAGDVGGAIAAAPRAGRGERRIQEFGDFTLVEQYAAGKELRLQADCKCHSNRGDFPTRHFCHTSLAFPDGQRRSVILALKRWLLYGYLVDGAARDGRTQHWNYRITHDLSQPISGEDWNRIYDMLSFEILGDEDIDDLHN